MDRRKQSRDEIVYRDKHLVVRRVFRPSGLRLFGAVDASNVGPLEEILAAALNGRSDFEVHVDLTRLEFCDVSGIRALVSAAKRSDANHRMVVHGLPPLMTKVMGVVGWTDLPGISIVDWDFPTSDGKVPSARAQQVS